MKRFIIISMTAVLAAAMLVGCGSSDTASTNTAETTETSTTVETTVETEATTDSDKVYKIGVIQYVQHDALDAANEGFFAALDDAGIKYEGDQQNASGDQTACQTISEKLVTDNDDLILAIATHSKYMF